MYEFHQCFTVIALYDLINKLQPIGMTFPPDKLA
jgi:hypothetical protein